MLRLKDREEDRDGLGLKQSEFDQENHYIRNVDAVLKSRISIK